MMMMKKRWMSESSHPIHTCEDGTVYVGVCKMQTEEDTKPKQTKKRNPEAVYRSLYER